MIVPSIDILGGEVVQLLGGEERVLTAGAPGPLAEQFSRVGEIAVIDLDAARGEGQNTALLSDLVAAYPCRVGGGIRDVETARAWLDRGAKKVILGTAARPDVLSKLPKERVIAAVDARDGEVVVEGWRQRTGCALEQRVSELADFVGGFLITFVEREGRMVGMDLDLVQRIQRAARGVRVTFAGGVRNAQEVGALHRLGADAQVGMALYQGQLTLAGSVFACLRSERDDGLVPTIVCDESGRALGLAWSNEESLAQALETGKGTYFSRRRGLWVKGTTSGATQSLLAVALDCDADALRVLVRQHGAGFCHAGTATCFGPLEGLPRLAQTLRSRLVEAPEGSYSARLMQDPTFLRGKLVEEAGELADARTPKDVVHEAADVMFFVSVALARAGVSLAEVERELDRRALKVERRAGELKVREEPS